MKKLKTPSNTSAVAGSGNVFADLELPDAAELMTKARIAHEICELVRQEGWTQTQAATHLGLDQPKVSSLMRGQLRGFSLERLLHCVTALGHDVDIVIRPPKHQVAHIRVAVPT